MGFQYNGKLRAPELLLRADIPLREPAAVDGGLSVPRSPPRTDLIRQRERVHCLFDNTCIPRDLESPAAPPFPYSTRPPPPIGAMNTPTAQAESSHPQAEASLAESGIVAGLQTESPVPEVHASGGATASGSGWRTVTGASVASATQAAGALAFGLALGVSCGILLFRTRKLL